MKIGAAALGVVAIMDALPTAAQADVALTVDRSARALELAERQSMADPTIPPDPTIPTSPTTSAPPNTSSEFLIVGDSLCELSLLDLRDAATVAGIALQLEIDCEGGRAPVAGVPIALGQKPPPEVLMFELGTNPGDEFQSMDAYDQVIAGLPNADIYFATGYREHPPGIQVGVDTLNDYMLSLAAEHDNVRVCDWASVIRANTEWFVDDIHYDDEGEAEFASFIISCMLGELHD